MIYFHSHNIITFISITDGSIASIVNRLCTGQPKNYGFNTRQGQEIALLAKASRLALGLIKSPIQ